MRGHALALLVLGCALAFAGKHDPSPCVKKDDGVWCPSLDGEWHHKVCHKGKHHGHHGKHHKDDKGKHHGHHGKHHQDGENGEMKKASANQNCGSLFSEKSSCEHAAQGKNYGTQPDPKTCGQLAAADGYSIVMFSPEYSAGENNWGCRACADPSQATPHQHWNFYSVRHCADLPPTTELAAEHHKGGKHHQVGQLTKPELKPDGQGCYTKPDGIWCPTESGMWIRDDGVEWFFSLSCHHHGWHHASWQRMCRLKIIGWALGALVLLIGLVWGYFERERRRGLAGDNIPAQSGGYISGLFECMRSPRICLPACFFTPVLAAFNRAKVDQRECGVCDVCFALIKPVAQYTTRQTIRGKYQLADENCSDALQACCCTPCAVAQDTLELEKRAISQTPPLPAPLTAPGMPPVYVTVDARPAEVCMDKMDKADNQV